MVKSDAPCLSNVPPRRGPVPRRIRLDAIRAENVRRIRDRSQMIPSAREGMVFRRLFPVPNSSLAKRVMPVIVVLMNC